jgi:hypothetical protein
MLKKRHKTNYTMVELLLVIAVVAMLMGLGVQGLRTVIRGTGVAGGIRSVGNKLTLARTFAISSRQQIAVVFPGLIKGGAADLETPEIMEHSLPSNDTLRKKYLFRCFRACIVEWDDTVSPNKYKFVRWCKGSDWVFTPGGTCGNFVDSAPGVVYMESSKVVADFDPQQMVKDIYMPAVVFGPSGGVDTEMSSSGDLKFVIFEDVYLPNRANSLPITRGVFTINGIDPFLSAGNTVKKGWQITINQFTGAITYDNYVRQ